MARKRPSERPGSARARLFAALDLPAPAREQLVEWRAGVLAGRSDLRPVAAEALHVTLVFLGYRPEEEVDAIGAAVAGAVDGLPAARLAFGGVTPLPPRRPRLFALDLEDSEARAAAVQAAVSDALDALGAYVPERRPFWPHVTFARVRRDARAAPLGGPRPPADPFEAGGVTLYRSHLSPRGARYEALMRADLAR